MLRQSVRGEVNNDRGDIRTLHARRGAVRGTETLYNGSRDTMRYMYVSIHPYGETGMDPVKCEQCGQQQDSINHPNASGRCECPENEYHNGECGTFGPKANPDCRCH